MVIKIVWMSWNFGRFHEIIFQADAESFSFLSWKTKKFYSKKKYFLGRCQYQNKKTLFNDPISSEGFDLHKYRNGPKTNEKNLAHKFLYGIPSLSKFDIVL